MTPTLNRFADSRWRIGTVLLGLMLACLVPGTIAVSVLFSREYLNGRAQLERDTIATARAMVQSVDSRLLRALTAVETLAASRVIGQHGLREFHQLARAVLRATDAGMNFVLSDRDGRQLVNTLREFGEPLPDHGNPATLHRVIETGKPVISELYLGAVLKAPVLSIDVPVMEDKLVVYVLTIGLLPSQFNGILESQRFPPGWVSAIFDNTGTIVARTHASEQFVGQKGTPEYVQRIKERTEGVMDTVTREGIPTLSVWSRSEVTDWSVGIGIPRSILDGELISKMGWLAAGMAAMTVLSLGLAWRVGREVANSLRALTIPARAMLDGTPVPIPRFRIQESAEIAEEIRQATALLAARALALKAANRDLERLASVDGLTGLHNRRSADEAIGQEFQRWKRTGAPYALLFIDIDFFKRINDTHGHEEGDRVLRQVAGVLQATVRASDFVARYGGEEFLAMLPNTTIEDALTVADAVRRRVAADRVPVSGQVTVSIGVAMAAEGDADALDAVHRADIALYQAKSAGRNAVRSG